MAPGSAWIPPGRRIKRLPAFAGPAYPDHGSLNTYTTWARSILYLRRNTDGSERTPSKRRWMRLVDFRSLATRIQRTLPRTSRKVAFVNLESPSTETYFAEGPSQFHPCPKQARRIWIWAGGEALRASDV